MYVLWTELKSLTTACNLKIKSLSNKLKPERPKKKKVSFVTETEPASEIEHGLFIVSV